MSRGTKCTVVNLIKSQTITKSMDNLMYTLSKNYED